MNLGLVLTIISLIYIVLIAIVYFSKQRITLLENKIYELIIIVSLVGFVLNIASFMVDSLFIDMMAIRIILIKIYYSYVLTFAFLITLYMLSASLDKQKSNFILKEKPKKIVFPVIIFYCVLILVNFILPLNHYEINQEMFWSGPNLIFLYSAILVMIIFWTIFIIKNYKRIDKRKYIPIIVFMLISIPVVYIQYILPELLLEPALITFVIIFMYFTIENPDLKMLNEMELAKNEAEKANKHKSDFLSSMSHEIRTPLNAIVGLSEINAQSTDLSEIRENSNDILNASNILLEIVGNVLDMSRIESGNVKIFNTDYNPYQVFNSVIKVVEYRYEEKKIKLNLNIAPDIPKTLYGDHANIKKILLNLLTNAVKYTNEGHVDLVINCVNKEDICRLFISVEDTGKGIKAEMIDQLFTKFNRLEEERNTTNEGTGLGLAITKHVINLMGGNIVVQSVYGKGSKFTVTLDQRIQMAVLSEKPNENLEAKDDKILTPTENQNTTNNFSNMINKRVLIIDDNKLNLKVAFRLLSKYGIKVIESDSGQNTLDRINNGEDFDLLLADEMMPYMSGTEMMKTLKEKGYKVPIIVLTADVENNAKEQYLASGFDDYLKKPIEKSELERVLKKYLTN